MAKLSIEQQLQIPFPPEDIEWRAQSSGIDKNGKPWAMIMPYVTNRAIQERLDEVFGVLGWQNEYRPVPNDRGLSFLCGITVPDGDGSLITKWDGADETNFENFKGGLSNSMKRSGVQYGIGRYLYKLDTYFANLTDDRKGMNFSVTIKKENNKRYYFNAPQLPAFALPENFKYEASKQVPEPDKNPPETEDEHEKAIEENLGGVNLTEQASKCMNDEALKTWWLGLTKEERKVAEAVKNNRKNEIAELGKQTANETPTKSYTLEELKAKKLPELHQVCKDLDLMGYTKKPKADVINLILKHINK